MKCACRSIDAHNCWALRYHGHTGVSELTVHNEGGPCECVCHEEDLYEEEDYEPRMFPLTSAMREGEQ